MRIGLKTDRLTLLPLVLRALVRADLVEVTDSLTDGTLGVVVRIVFLSGSVPRNLFSDTALRLAAPQSAFGVRPIALGLREHVGPPALSMR